MIPDALQRKRADDIFLRALDLSPDERVSLLERECGSDMGLREEVQSLLAHYAAAEGTFLDTPAYPVGAMRHSRRPVRIGSYTVERLIGAGGMGEVYEVRQVSPARQVAIKVMRPDMAHGRGAARFRHEAEILGRLQHPGIAHIYEAGEADITYDDGSRSSFPYLAMELIRGEPLLEYVKQQSLDRDAKLKLFADVCDAVQYAHQKGVIHRDLKPANIVIDRAGKARILDFGVARLTDSDIHHASLRTEVGQLLGTLSYMSPEQVAGGAEAIDSRSDVYSLGVILYELLSGQLPYQLRGMSIPQAARTVQEEAPARISSVKPEFRGDAEIIVHKALEKEPARRYQSAAEVASDVRRFLSDQPILARPASAGYQLGKLARRHRVATVAIGIAVLALVAGTIVSIREAIAADRQRVLAEQRLAETRSAIRDADATVKFLTDMLSSADPGARGREVLVTDVLKKAASDIAQHPENPTIEARLREAIGKTYAALGKNAEAVEHLQRAAELRTQLGGPDDRLALALLRDLAVVNAKMSRGEQAITTLEDLLRRQRASFGDDDADVCTTKLELGSLLRDAAKFDEAELLIRSTWAVERRLHGDDDERTTVALSHLARLLKDRGKLAEAQPLDRRIMETFRKKFGSDHPRTINAITNYAEELGTLGQAREAEPYYREAMDRSRRVFGADHESSITAAHNFASFQYRQGRLEEAEALERQVVASDERTIGKDHADTLNSTANLAAILRTRGKSDEAIALQRDVLDRTKRTLGGQHPRTLIAMHNLAQMMRGDHKLSDAEAMERGAMSISEKINGKDHPSTLVMLTQLGVILLDEKKSDEAASVLRTALDARRRVLPAGHPDLARSAVALARALSARGQDSEAEPLFAEGTAIFAKLLPPDHPDRLAGDAFWGACLLRLSRFEKAEPILRAAFERANARFGSQHRQTQELLRSLIACCNHRNPHEGEQYRALLVPAAEH